jgi:hypothetical protein
LPGRNSAWRSAGADEYRQSGEGEGDGLLGDQLILSSFHHGDTVVKSRNDITILHLPPRLLSDCAFASYYRMKATVNCLPSQWMMADERAAKEWVRVTEMPPELKQNWLAWKPQ